MSFLILTVFNLCLIGVTILFTYESFREKEPRAPKFGLGAVVFHLILAALIWAFPSYHPVMGVYYGLLIFLGILMIIPTSRNKVALAGSKGIIHGDVRRFDERDQVFARNETLHPDRKEYDLYYKDHPELKDRDDHRRSKGGDLGDPGSIDGGYPPNVSMLFGTFDMCYHLESIAVNIPENPTERVKIDPEKATEVVKGFAKQLGAELVGVCEVDQNWVYSHRGEIHMDNWEEWGTEIKPDLPYAVVIATEMKHDVIVGAPHTPAVIESSRNYAKGAHISTILARWFSHLGYRASAQHATHYDALMVPLAVEAGLGQMGRQGYLISDEYGCGVRIFAVLTDMPLIPDKPVDLGVEEFCTACLKCAEACPSRSIPLGDKTITNGISRWKLDAESCHDYWGRVGTDCCVCMAICPYTRPNRGIHKVIKWVLKRSKLARLLLPHLDNVVYGRKWRTRQVPKWIDYRQQ